MMMNKKTDKNSDKNLVEIANLKQGWQRTLADFDNFRKRVEADKKLWAQDTKIDLAQQLLPVLDNFDMATAHISEAQKKDAVIQGLLHIHTQLIEVLASNNITKIAVQPGDQFNPNLHDAIESLDGQGGTIIAEVRLAGYEINDVVIRPAKVVVKNAK